MTPRTLATLLLAAALFACGSGKSRYSSKVQRLSAGDACQSDADCNEGNDGAGIICTNNTCADGCRSDTDCPSGLTCGSNGQCQAQGGGAGCATDADCGDLYCNPITTPAQCTPFCSTDSDCGDGNNCDLSSGKCRLGNPGSGGGGQACADDSDCGDQFCNTALSPPQCTPYCTTDADCPGANTCVSNRCQPAGGNGGGGGGGVGAPCGADSDCQAASGLVCSNESRTCIAGCHSDESCSNGQYCNKALPTWTCSDSCSADSDCNQSQAHTGLICASPAQRCAKGCHQDSDCAEGLACSDDTCVASQPAGGVAGYDPAAAVSYADAHWNDGNGLCAQFVSDSAASGGLDLGLSSNQRRLVPYLYTALTTTLALQGDPSGAACPGDIVIYSNSSAGQFCPSPGNETTDHPNDLEYCGHTALVVVGGADGQSALADAHNNARYHRAIAYLASSGQTYQVFHLSSCQYSQ